VFRHLRRFGRKIRIILFFLVGVVQADDSPNLLFSELDKTGMQWYPYLEWSIQNTTYSGNPYDLVATVTFINSVELDTHITEMFYDSTDTTPDAWKFRFSGTYIGDYTFTSSSTDPDLDSLSGTVTINYNSDLNAHGFIKNFDSKWGWQGTEETFVPQLVMYDHPLEYYNNASKIDVDIDTFLVDHGFSGFHTRVFCRWFDINKEIWDNIRTNPNPDPKTFEALELLITKTHEAGGMVHIWAWGDSASHRTTSNWGKNGTVDQRLQRYIAARLGPLPGWSMGYGYDNDEWVKENDLEQWHTYMQEKMGWNHFLGARDPNPNTSSDPVTQIYEALDYSGYEQWKPTYDDYIRVIDARPSKPTFSEDRFRVRTSSYPWKDYTELETRRGLYVSTMAGGAANIWGYALDGYSAGGGSKPYPNKQWIKTYSQFFENHFYSDFVRDNSITDGYCLKNNANSHYIFYQDSTSEIRLDLAQMDGSQSAIAVDAALDYAEINIGPLIATNQVWTAPYVSDWVIAVGDFSEEERILVEVKIFLEGPYDVTGDTMRTTLRDNDYIPLTSPYLEDPRTATFIPKGIVDWVLLELRDTEAGPAVASKSVFLRFDGRIVADDGATGQILFDLIAGDYYIVIKHRNHLSVMSANAVILSGESPSLYDFTISSSGYYDTGGCTEIESGVWGMWGGNSSNGDQDIFASDLAVIRMEFLLGSYGYNIADTDMDSDVFASDYALCRVNMLAGIYSTVPNP